MNLEEWRKLSPEEQKKITPGLGTRMEGCALSGQLEDMIDDEYKGAGYYYSLAKDLDEIGADQESGVIKKLHHDELLHFFILKGIVEHLNERYGCSKHVK